MPTCTPLQMYPYPIGSDAPCNIDETLCAFAAAVEVDLDALDATVDRVVTTIPQAQVRLTIPALLAQDPGGGAPALVPFDTVDVDTGNMVDLTANPYIITLPALGRYHVYAQYQGLTIGTGNTIRAAAATVAQEQYIDDASSPIFLNMGAEVRYNTDITSAQISFTVSAAAVAPTVTAVTFGVYWLGDLP